MPDPVTAIVGSSVVGVGSSVLSSRSASKAASSASDASSYAAELQYETSMEQLDFAKQQYADWESIFGPVQQNLSNYYQNLNSDTIASLGIQNIEQEFARSSKLLDENLAKRGMANSGATAQGLSQLEQARMLGRAEVRTNAPMQAAQQKLGFLSTGLGIQGGLNSSIQNAYTNQVGILGQQSANQLNTANQYRQQAASSMTGVGTSIGAGIQNYLTYSAISKLPGGL